MQKINFEDLPSTATPINATNLNAVQTNMENAINDLYTSGSWTPTLEGVNATYTEQTGQYRKIKDIVIASFRIVGTINSLSTNPAYAFINNLPYSALFQQAGSLFEHWNCCDNNINLLLRITGRQLCLQFDDVNCGATASQWVAGQGTFYLSGTAVYIAE